jgi:hypothetical protein
MKVRKFLSSHEHFFAVKDETRREELFYVVFEESRKRVTEKKDNYLAFLKLKEEDGKLRLNSGR